MSFLHDNEFMILMNSNADIGGYGLPFISMDTNQLRQVKDATGITVAQEQIYWHDIERGWNDYHWELPDKQVKRVLDAGMRLILCVPITIPAFFPDNWYWMNEHKQAVKHGLSFWHQEAQAYQREFIRMVIARYASADINVIFHGFLGGESVMHNHPAFYDECAIAEFKHRYGQDAMPVVGTSNVPTGKMPFALDDKTKEWLYDAVVGHHIFMHEAFVHQHNEVWDDLQYLIGWQSEANGNLAQRRIHEAYDRHFPGVEHWLLMYTYFGNGPESVKYTNQLAADFNCKVIVEANYCEGLRDFPHTYDLAIAQGFRGQIVCPLHPFRKHRTVEPWMMDVMKQANDAWKNSRIREGET